MGLAERLMRSRATISRQTLVSDGQGGWHKDHEVIATDVPCKLDPASETEELEGDQERESVRWRAFLPIVTDIERGDLLEVDGHTVEVQAIEPPGGIPFSNAGGQVRVMCEEFQRATPESDGGSGS